MLFFVLGNLHVSGQNLIANPSFECGEDPCFPTQVPEQFNHRYACFWYCPSSGTTDVFSTLLFDPACYSSMPYRGSDVNEFSIHVGSQLPRTGNRFAGIYTLSMDADTSYREYLAAHLTEPLVVGEYYCGTMYVSLAEHLQFASGNLGMFFSESYIFNPGTGPIIKNPQILESNIILDSLNWVKISGPIKPILPYEYLAIGNFGYNFQTHSIEKGGGIIDKYNYPHAFYFVDDVSVIRIDTTQVPVSGPREICKGDYTDLVVSSEWDNVEWKILGDDAILSNNFNLRHQPTTSIAYIVRGSICKISVTDTIAISVKPSPDIDLGRDTTICAGDQLILDSGDEELSVRWQDNSAGRFFSVEEAGVYSVTIENALGCVATDQIDVSVLAPPSFSLGGDTIICGAPILVSVSQPVGDYYWSTGSTSTSITVDHSGEYWLHVSNQCGEKRDTLRVLKIDEIKLPNVVTANGDTLNAKFIIENQLIGIRPAIDLYNRWGKVVYSQSSYDNSWPANYNQSSGIFYYQIMFPGCPPKRGWVHVLTD